MCVASALADPCRNAGEELEFIFHVPPLVSAPSISPGYMWLWRSLVKLHIPPPTPQLGIDGRMFMVQNTWLHVPSTQELQQY